MMKRLTICLAAMLACGLTVGLVFAGGEACQKAAQAQQTAACAATCSGDSFPSMTMMVGDKSYNCPMEAGKAASAAKAKVVYAVGKDKFECQEKAAEALACASEKYVKQFTSLACIIDGKIKYCDESSCGDKATVTKVSAKSDSACCMESGKAVKAASCSSTCGTEGAAQTKAVKAGDKPATCDKAAGAETVKVVKADEKPATCDKSAGEMIKIVKAGDAPATCDKSGTTVAAKSPSGCCAAKAAAQTKLASAGEGCSATKGDATQTKLASTGSGCCASKGAAVQTKLASAGEACCKDAKNVKYTVAGRTFDKYEDAVKARDQVRAAVAKVSMKYIVDGKEIDCSSKVCPMAKKDGKVQYVVEGKKIGCETMARINLAKAQYEAARNASGEKMAKM